MGVKKSKQMEQQRLFFNKWLYRRLPYFLRRRLTPQQAPFVLVVILAAFVIVFQLILMFNNNDEIEALEQKLKTLKTSKSQHHRRPLAQIIGIDPKLRRFYVPTDKNKFVCLDSNQEIPFDWVNDDFCDCPNGSDEPATGACQKITSTVLLKVKVLLRGYLVVASMMAFATVVTAVMNGQATNLYLKPWTKGIKKSYINSKHHAMIDVIL